MTRVSTIDPRQFKIVDSTLWIPDSRYWIQDSLVGSLFIGGSCFCYYRLGAIPDIDFRMRYDVVASRSCRVDFSSCYELSNCRKPAFPNSNCIRGSRPPEDNKETFMIYEVVSFLVLVLEKSCVLQ